MSKDESEGQEIDNFKLSDTRDVYIEIQARESNLVLLSITTECVENRLMLFPDEAERIGYAMLKAAAHIDPTRAQRIAVYLRGADLTP